MIATQNRHARFLHPVSDYVFSFLFFSHHSPISILRLAIAKDDFIYSIVKKSLCSLRITPILYLVSRPSAITLLLPCWSLAAGGAGDGPLDAHSDPPGHGQVPHGAHVPGAQGG